MSYRGIDRGRGRGGPSGSSGRGSPDVRGRGGSPDFRGRGGGPDRGRGGGPDRGRGGYPDRGHFDRGGGRGGGFRGGGGGGGRGGGGIFAPGQPADVDARLKDGTQDALVASFRTLAVGDTDLPLRPGFGTVGTPIKLRANFFPVKVPKGSIFEYDVSISPTAGTAIRRVKRRIFELAERTADWQRNGLKGNVAHDHSSKLIAAKKLPQPLVIRLVYTEDDEDNVTATKGKKSTKKPEPKEYTLTIEHARNLDMQGLVSYLAGQREYRDYDPLPIISALNVILAAHPNRTSAGGGVMVGRNRFFFPSASSPPISLGGGLEAWRGFFSSVRPTHNQLMVNVNVCTTAFYTPGNLADAMRAFRDSSFGARPSAFVKGLRIEATHPERPYKKTIKALSNHTARTYKFKIDGVETTVEAYFQKNFKKLQQPDLPLVQVGLNNFLPPEVCRILPNQAFRGKLTDEHTANMITIAARPPNINGDAIVGRGLSELGYRQGADPLGAFGISIGTEMTIVPGRILTAPGIKYKQGTPAVDERASWNLRNVKFDKGGRLKNWAVLLIQDGNPRDEFTGPQDSELRNTITGFANMCKASGMDVAEMTPPIVAASLPPKDRNDPTRARAVGEIRTALTRLKLKPVLVMVILSNGDKHVYAGIKHLCDSYLDIATVCVHSSKIRKEKGQLQYFANVALKVNMKMGGRNHSLDPRNMAWFKQMPTMLVGIDVTHPGPGSIKGTPSIAAVVASIDEHFAQYPASMEIQETKKEMVTNLANMMEERLKLFREINKSLPQRVLVYRDGVSEGQFPIVVNDELFSIRAAFKKFDTARAPYKPKLSIVICGKRHHTRFYPTEQVHADSNGNPRPGTVVDRGVTAVYDFDFFLQAHGGLQGTTRPTHYYVVHDEIGFKADELQGLTNSVSYMFARATKAVSLVSPAYYADLACERGRCYIHKLLQGISGSGGTATSQNEEAIMREAVASWHAGVMGVQLKNTMYYL